MTAVQLKKLGTAKRLEYTKNGRRYVHDFPAGTELGFFTRGRALVIAPVDLEGGKWIADKPAKRPAKRRTKPTTKRPAKRRTKRTTKRKGG